MNKRLLALLVAIPIAVTGCSSSGSGGDAKTSSPAPSPTASLPTSADNGGGTQVVKGKVTVYAASSLTEAFNTLKPQFEKLFPGTSVTFQYGASSDLATMIKQGAPADVFASAAPSNMMQIGSDAVSPKTFVSNVGEVAIPPKNPGKITKLADLAKSGVKVAACAPAVPCGVIASSVFKNAKLTVKPVANPANVKDTLALVESGEVDAGIVYVTDVKAAGTKVKGVPIPSSVNATTTYPIARLKDAKNTPVAEAFIQYVLGTAGQKVLAADGFGKP